MIWDGYSQCGTPTVRFLNTTGPNEIYRPSSISEWQAGDTIKIVPTNLTVLELYGNYGGTDECPIVIVANTSLYSTVIRFNGGVHHIKLLSSGGGKDSTTTRNIQAGAVTGGWSHHITVDGLKVGNAGMDNGIYWKRDVSYADPLTWSSNFRSTGNKFLNMWITRGGGEAMYIGNTSSSGVTVTSSWSGLDTLIYPVFVDSTIIANNYINLWGWDGPQLSGGRDGNEIYGNTVAYVGLDNEPSQMCGILAGGNTRANVYNNTIINATGNGIELFGYGTMSVSGNTIINSGEASIFANSYPTSENIKDPLQQLIITNNQITNPPLDGAIRLYNDFRGHLGHNISNNFFCIDNAPDNWQSIYFTIYTPPSSINNNNTLRCETPCNCTITNILRSGKYIN